MLRAVRALRVAAERGIRQTSAATGAEPAAPSSSTHDPASGVSWKSIGLGVTTLGFMGSSMAFFSDRAHKDNEATRRELREDIKALEARVDKRFDKLEASLQEISGYLRPAPKK